jgi:small subunit ribosomal protein S6
MQNYELMVIFTPVLSEEEFKSSQKKYADFILANNGEIVHSNPWGLKSLAYPVQKKTTGIYWVLEYKAQSDINEKLKIQLLRDEQVLRHQVIKLDKYAVEYTAIKTEKPKKKFCRFKKYGIRYIDYKDAEFLKKFLNDQGKLLPRRLTGNSLKYQRKVSEAVKRARQMAILPYVTDLLK